MPRTAIRVPAVLAIAGAAVAITGAGVYAVLTATAFNEDPQRVTSGVLSLTLADSGSAGFASDVVALAPGQSAERFVTLTNGGSLGGKDLTLQAVAATANKLSTDAALGLQVAVDSCSVAWSGGTCSGTVASELASPLATLGTAKPLTDGVMAAGEVKHLRVTVALPDQSETTVNGVLPADTVQGLAADLTWTFAETQQLG